MQRAIEEEYRRQVEAVKKGEAIVQETRRFDQTDGQNVSSMRRKENANDYRYFPDPDLAPIVAERRQSLPGGARNCPQLPDVRKARVHGGLRADGVRGGAAGLQQISGGLL